MTDAEDRDIVDNRLRCPNGHLLSTNMFAPAGGRFFCKECGWTDDELPEEDDESQSQ